MAAVLEESALIVTRLPHQHGSDEETETISKETDSFISVSHSVKGRRCLKYRSRGSVGKGALLVIVSSLALHIAIPYGMAAFLLERLWSHIPLNHTSYLSMYNLLCLLFPLSGFIADSVFGRYKVILSSIILLVISSSMMLIGFLLYHISSTYSAMIASTVITGIAAILNFIGFAGHDANVIQFLTDQSVGASGEELSGLIHIYFGVESCTKLLNILLSKFLWRNNGIAITEMLIIHFIMSCVTLYSYIILKQHLDTSPRITNPIKLIYKVLKYAKQNQYPRNRSALTYWEDTKLTRINMAKSKYGGPFTEEEVEDVKTGLRLIPIIVLTAGIGILVSSKPCTSFSKREKRSIDQGLLTTFVDESVENAILTVVFVLLYHYLIYPILYRYVPSLLRLIGIGMLLIFISQAYLTILDPVRNYIDDQAICIFNSTISTRLNGLWCFPYTTISAISHLLVVLFGFEFIVAQTPQSMKGMAIGLWFAFSGIIEIFFLNMHYLFTAVENTSKFNCGFYFFLTKTLMSVILLVLYILVAKRYTLRVRDSPVNVNIIAEDHYIKYMDIPSPSADDRSISSCSSCTSD